MMPSGQKQMSKPVLVRAHVCKGVMVHNLKAGLEAQQPPHPCPCNIRLVSALEKSSQAIQCWGSHPGARSEQDTCRTQVEQRKLEARPSMVSAKPEVAKII